MCKTFPWTILLATCITSPAWPSEPITPDQFATLHQLIRPQLGEDAWTQIPWLTDLWQARQRAAKEGKPILLWEMDGHPLGCT